MIIIAKTIILSILFILFASFCFADVNINPDYTTNIFKGYANVTFPSDFFAYHYTWFKDGVNISYGQYAGSDYVVRTQENPDSYYAYGPWDALGPIVNAFDNDYDTYAFTGGNWAWVEENWTISPNVTRFVWHPKGYGPAGETVLDLDLPGSCFINETLMQVKVGSYGLGGTYLTRYFCKNSTGWQILDELSRATSPGRIYYEDNATIYETAMLNLSNKSINIANLTPIGMGTYYFAARAFNGTNLSLWYNSSNITIPSINLTIYNEMNLSYMDISTIEEVRLDIFCDNKTQRIKINDSVTSLNASCFWKYMNLWFIYNTSTSYYRTLIPSYGYTYKIFGNATFYMIDLYNNSAVLWDVGLLDIEGYYDGEPFFITKLTDNNGTIELIKQFPDIENYVHLYLVKDETYALNIYSSTGVLRVIGNIEASAAAEKIATLPQIDFHPDAYLSESIAVSEDFEPDAGIIRVTYGDSSELTEWVSITIKNASDTDVTLDAYNTTTQNFTYTYGPVDSNQSYLIDMEYKHPVIGTQHRISTKGVPVFGTGNIDFSWMFKNGTNITKVKKASGNFLIVGTALLFPAEHVVAGIIILFMEFFAFSALGLLNIDSLTVGLFTVMLVLSIGRGILKNRK